MSKVKTALITGANRGLGFEAARQLGKAGYHVILTSRDPEKGANKTAELREAGLDVEFLPLDVAKDESVQKVAQYVRDNVSTLDAIINNAGVFEDPIGMPEASILNVKLETIRSTFEINTLGPLRLIQRMSPFMRGGGSIVNVSSGMGQLSDMEGECPAYRISKTALNAVTRIAAEELKGSRIRVNAICPGWVRTDMGGPNADRDIEKGVETIVWAAMLPDDGPTGKFFRDKQEIPW